MGPGLGLLIHDLNVISAWRYLLITGPTVEIIAQSDRVRLKTHPSPVVSGARRPLPAPPIACIHTTKLTPNLPTLHQNSSPLAHPPNSLLLSVSLWVSKRCTQFTKYGVQATDRRAPGMKLTCRVVHKPPSGPGFISSLN